MKTYNPFSLELLARRLLETRRAAKQAKMAMRKLAAEIGTCNRETAFDPENGNMLCCQTNLPKEKWCGICLKKLPLWENYHAKVNAASAALRALLRAASYLPSTTNDP